MRWRWRRKSGRGEGGEEEEEEEDGKGEGGIIEGIMVKKKEARGLQEDYIIKYCGCSDRRLVVEVLSPSTTPTTRPSPPEIKTTEADSSPLNVGGRDFQFFTSQPPT